MGQYAGWIFPISHEYLRVTVYEHLDGTRPVGRTLGRYSSELPISAAEQHHLIHSALPLRDHLGIM